MEDNEDPNETFAQWLKRQPTNTFIRIPRRFVKVQEKTEADKYIEIDMDAIKAAIWARSFLEGDEQ